MSDRHYDASRHARAVPWLLFADMFIYVGEIYFIGENAYHRGLIDPWPLPMSLRSFLQPAFLIVALAATTVWAQDEQDDYRDLGWRSNSELQQAPAAQQPSIDATCPGGFLVSVHPIHPVPGDDIWAYADHAVTLPDGKAELQGHVTIKQVDKQADADQAEMYRQSGYARLQGHILVTEPGYSATGSRGESYTKTKETHIDDARWAMSAMHAHGRARSLWRRDDGVTSIRDGEISTCAPGHRDWWLRSNRIKLDPNTGRGEAVSSVLYSHDLPLLYIPYINFPIDDRRQSGILIPTLASNSINGLTFTLPIYINLAANYDLTLTPSWMAKRGVLMQGDFRYLEDWGHGEIAGGYLNNDRLGYPALYDPTAANPNTSPQSGETRKSLGWQHDGSFAPGWTAKVDLNYVSDNYYYQDFATNVALNTSTYQNRLGMVHYADKDWTWMAQEQSTQVTDPTVVGVMKPYARLPETALSRLWRSPDHLFNAGFTSDYVDFRRTINDGTGTGINGNRLRFDPFAGMRLDAPWGYLAPTVKLRHINDQIFLASEPSNPATALPGAYIAPSGIANGADITVPTSSIDSGLYFDRDLSHGGTQTLEPRLYYLNAPYRAQSQLPNFDTMDLPMSYDQLFRDSRFVGGDRLDDANQLAFGVTSRFLDDSGNETYRFSVGDLAYFRHRDVLATLPVATQSSSGPVAHAMAKINNNWSLTSDLVIDPSLNFTQRGNMTLHWQPDNSRLLNLGFNYIHGYPMLAAPLGAPAIAQNTTTPAITSLPTYQQVMGSVVTPLADRWQLIGLWQYDMVYGHTQQAIAGLQYESCCWRVRFLDSLYLSDYLAINNIPQYARSFMVQFEFKGLGGYSNQVNNFLSQSILGFQQISNAERP